MFVKRIKKGFTLIELLVVIAIIGVLASIVLASLNSARRKSRDARRIADIKQIQLALELSFDANSAKYPTNIYTTCAAAGSICPSYIPAVPTDPLGGNYLYAGLGAGAACSSYHLGATLEEGASPKNPALDNDIDAAAGTECTGSGADFAGTDPIYDMKP
ncbi:MAG: prepilin-type N-terminal cleavage/methylation domain-containing protein [bacterium]|nr:prepilin-type N-terminal cleavage/methylation domain-containing protein [bacterium]